MGQNKILDQVYNARKGYYCHCVEVNTAYDLEIIAETIYNDFIDEYTVEDVIEFLETLEVYSLDDENEEEIYNFDFTEFINQCN